jgi:hypothetical protein
MRTINLSDVSPKRRYTADPKYPMCSNWVIDRLIELIENGETFTDTVCCTVKSGCNCCVSTWNIDTVFLDMDFEEAGNPVYIDDPDLRMQIFRWNNIYYYLTY